MSNSDSKEQPADAINIDSGLDMSIRFMQAAEALLNSYSGPTASGMRAVMTFRKTLWNETDRGCALMAAAYLDEELKSLLQAKLVDDRKSVTKVFAFNGPLGSFSARIDMVFLLGLLPKSAKSDLHRLRSIRNQFAHEVEPITFEHENIAPICRALLFGVARPESEPRYRFERAMVSLAKLIILTKTSLTHLPAAPEADLFSSARAAAFIDEVLGSLPAHATGNGAAGSSENDVSN